jgi:hypothetical protein
VSNQPVPESALKLAAGPPRGEPWPTTTSVSPKRKRGRPKSKEVVLGAKRRVGRPRKQPLNSENDVPPPPKRKAGRPSKVKNSGGVVVDFGRIVSNSSISMYVILSATIS